MNKAEKQKIHKIKNMNLNLSTNFLDARDLNIRSKSIKLLKADLGLLFLTLSEAMPSMAS